MESMQRYKPHNRISVAQGVKLHHVDMLVVTNRLGALFNKVITPLKLPRDFKWTLLTASQIILLYRKIYK